MRVLVVDDSASVRQALKAVFATDAAISVMGTAGDPFAAIALIAKEVPDVITLDVEMPRMDGLQFLEEIMRQHPIPVVICSSLASAGSSTALSALEKGAVDIVTKPDMGTVKFFEESAARICEVVKAASQARVGRRRLHAPVVAPPPKLTADAVLPPSPPRSLTETTDKVVVVGASTGGTEALRVLICALPADTPGIVVVQHMPEKFTASFAERLNELGKVRVKEAENGDRVLRGHVLIAPGNRHLLLKLTGAKYYVEVRDGPQVSRHRPSVDVLFRSAARYAGSNALGVIMTGMGDDGARGMLEMRQAGAETIAQDEATSVVYGMPREAVERGGVQHVRPLDLIAPEVVRFGRAVR